MPYFILAFCTLAWLLGHLPDGVLHFSLPSLIAIACMTYSVYRLARGK